MNIYLANDAVAKVLVVLQLESRQMGWQAASGTPRKDYPAMGRLCLIRVVFGKAGANGRTQPVANLYLRIW